MENLTLKVYEYSLNICILYLKGLDDILHKLKLHIDTGKMIATHYVKCRNSQAISQFNWLAKPVDYINMKLEHFYVIVFMKSTEKKESNISI